MIIGLISDTHGMLSRKACDALQGCDAIIHAGDIGGTFILMQLETIAPVTAVLGNNDFNDYGPSVNRSAMPIFDNVRFLVVHRPCDVGVPDPSVSVVVTGHTHRTRNETIGDVLYVNPGSASEPHGGEAPTVAKLKLEGGMVKGVEFIELN